MPEPDETTPAQPDPETDPQIQEEPAPDSTLAAIIRCREAYNEAFEACCNGHGGPGKASTYQCEKEASVAFRDVLPPLSSRQNILDFIGCVAEGVLMDAIPENASGKLIYAAQAALGALPREPKMQKKAKKRTPPHPRVTKKVNRGDSQLTSSIQAA